MSKERDELNSHLLYRCEQTLNGIMCIIADYTLNGGKVNGKMVKRTLTDSTEMLADSFVRLTKLDEKEKAQNS